jgi:hypothetical protein
VRGEGGSATAYDYCNQDPINCYDLTGEHYISGKSVLHSICRRTHRDEPGRLGDCLGAAGVQTGTLKLRRFRTGCVAGLGLKAAYDKIEGKKSIQRDLEALGRVMEGSNPNAKKIQVRSRRLTRSILATAKRGTVVRAAASCVLGGFAENDMDLEGALADTVESYIG